MNIEVKILSDVSNPSDYDCIIGTEGNLKRKKNISINQKINKIIVRFIKNGLTVNKKQEHALKILLEYYQVNHKIKYIQYEIINK